MTTDRLAILELLAEYGGLLDHGRYEEWLALFAPACRYSVVPRENYDRGLPVALISCTTRAALEDGIEALQQANKFNIHSDRHLIGLPRVVAERDDSFDIEAPFTVYQTDQEGETRLFVTGLYRDRLLPSGGSLKIAEKLVLLDTSAVPSLLATPL